MSALLGIGIGAPGLGGEPSRTRTRPDRCDAYDHPLVTYNPWSDETWCLCGTVRRPGNQVEWAFMACSGTSPLIEVVS